MFSVTKARGEKPQAHGEGINMMLSSVLAPLQEDVAHCIEMNPNPHFVEDEIGNKGIGTPSILPL